MIFDTTVKDFIEDFMFVNCKYCREVKSLNECNVRFTKCLDKALYIAYEMKRLGWVKSENWKKVV